ncbi:MAG: MarR family winged helix-turn-helix transcriptional regulator [Rhodospirillales bacterium]|nr:MarR family winged helix-turn-helix transcriptional regulator [Rhodospirillales bacterium]MCW9001616.1 MarR family winged helix-turn-helix transcriptional regulator [Rhodospirillales bacterium]MCW9039057.1 MarR family winged helix-turn-helix transcriptional regulator [Rhodospirillales bacterium]
MRSIERRLGLLLMENGLTVSQFRFLLLFAGKASRSVSEAAALLAVTRASASQQAQGLSDAGLVEMRTDPEDGRGRLVRLTGRGSERLQSALVSLRALEADLSETLSEDQIEAFNQMDIAQPAPSRQTATDLEEDTHA